jgi:serine/threonine-protein kinase
MEGIDLRSDLWAIGVILYELLAGQLPFDAPNYNAMLILIATRQPKPVEELVPELDPALAAIVGRALATERDQRFATAREMHTALKAWLQGSPVAGPALRVLRPTPHPSATPMGFETADTLYDAQGATRPRASRLPWVVGGVIAVVTAVASFLALRGSHPPAATPAPVVSTPVAHLLRLDGLPAGAHVLINGQAAELPARVNAGGSYRVEVQAPGFRRWQHVVDNPTQDQAIAYRGEREEAEAPPPVPVVPTAHPATPHPAIAAHPHPTTVPAIATPPTTTATTPATTPVVHPPTPPRPPSTTNLLATDPNEIR